MLKLHSNRFRRKYKPPQLPKGLLGSKSKHSFSESVKRTIQFMNEFYLKRRILDDSITVDIDPRAALIYFRLLLLKGEYLNPECSVILSHPQNYNRGLILDRAMEALVYTIGDVNSNLSFPSPSDGRTTLSLILNMLSSVTFTTPKHAELIYEVLTRGRAHTLPSANCAPILFGEKMRSLRFVNGPIKQEVIEYATEQLLDATS